jgi:hypothetical protein
MSDPVWFVVSRINGVEYPGVLTDPLAKNLRADSVVATLRIDDRPDFAELATLPLAEMHKRLKSQLTAVDNRKKSK